MALLIRIKHTCPDCKDDFSNVDKHYETCPQGGKPLETPPKQIHRRQTALFTYTLDPADPDATDHHGCMNCHFHCSQYEEYVEHFNATHVIHIIKACKQQEGKRKAQADWTSPPSKRTSSLEQDLVSELAKANQEIGKLKHEIKLMQPQLITSSLFDALPPAMQRQVLGKMLARD
ncbi:hypothetical protein BC940DRAFT_370844 [Gongronella butleri]|nr:hypothetical protein BC940DRAFT_370844 [Gongronella butleri]